MWGDASAVAEAARGSEALARGFHRPDVALQDQARHVKSGSTKFLLDGFPRDVSSDWAFGAACTEINDDPDEPCMVNVGRLPAALLFDCPKHIAKQRFLERARGDDNADTFDRRFQEYEKYKDEIVVGFGDRLIQVSHTARLSNAGSVFSTSKASHKAWQALHQLSI